VEDASELWQDVRARGFVGALPEGDVFLGLADEASELSLAEASGFAQGEQAGSLGGSRLLGAARHERSVRVELHGTGDEAWWGLRDKKYTSNMRAGLETRHAGEFRLTAKFCWRRRWPGSLTKKSSG